MLRTIGSAVPLDATRFVKSLKLRLAAPPAISPAKRFAISTNTSNSRLTSNSCNAMAVALPRSVHVPPSTLSVWFVASSAKR